MQIRAFPVLYTERLCLRSPVEEDIPHLLKISQEEDVMRFYGVEPYKSMLEARKEVDWMPENLQGRQRDPVDNHFAR